MDWSEHVVREFGQQIGISNLALIPGKRVQLDVDDGTRIGMISLTTIPIPELIIYVTCETLYISPELLKKILQISRYRSSVDWPLQAGHSERRLFFAFRIPERSVSLVSINEAIKSLRKIMANFSIK